MRVLLIDDCAGDRALAALALRAAQPGVEVIEASDALSFARQLGAEGEFDAAIGTHGLAWADGLDVLGAARERWPRAALVLLEPSLEHVEQARQVRGIDALLPKNSAGFLALATTLSQAVTERSRATRDDTDTLARLPVGVFILDQQGALEYANPALLEALGRAAHSSLAGTVFDSLLPDAGQQATFAAAIAARRALVDFDVELERPGGKRWWARINLAPPAAGGGECWHGVLHDISVLRQADARLASRAEDLRRSNAELEQIAYALSHDLQEPMQLVNRHARLLQEHHAHALAPDAARSLGHVISSAARMQAMIDGVLAYARLSSGQPPPGAVDLGSVLEEVLATFADTISSLGAVVEVPESLPRVRANRQQIFQLLQNLISNALKFHSGRAPRIRVRAAIEEAGRCRVSVSDNGIGIAPDDVHRVFGMFQRLHTEQEYPGTGIGLALCKRIVEAHGGHLEARPNPDGGSVFSFTLPAADTGEHGAASLRREHCR